MDFSKNSVLKENYSFFVGNSDGFITGGEHGLYNRDTRFLSHYVWHFPKPSQTLVLHSPHPDKLNLHHAELDQHRQLSAVKRRLILSSTRLSDSLILENNQPFARTFQLELSIGADFADLFEARGWHSHDHKSSIDLQNCRLSFSHKTPDGLLMVLSLDSSEAFTWQDNQLLFSLEVAAKSSKELTINLTIHNPLEKASKDSISYETWRSKFSNSLAKPSYQAAFNRAVDDLRALLLFDEAGTLPAAGIPWFVAAFGRDALLTAFMLLPYAPDIARGSLRYLAKHQATGFDSFRNAQPGKILHEMRYGTLSRTGKTPHSPYYGTVDASPLFIRLLYEVYKLDNDLDFVKEMQAHWEAALSWMISYADLDNDGFLEFQAAEVGKGLVVQSWKDSGDSMSHANGELAQGALAVSEVQGYAYAAYQAAVSFYEALNDRGKADYWQTKAQELKERFHQHYWLEDMQTYAMALDGTKNPLKVHNSDAGQLLWTGIVAEAIAPALVKTLMSETMWTGWGIRTLGKDELRYNPVSYHNGSVWPHDSSLIASGMMRYGFKEEAQKIATAIFDLAASQADLRVPELVGGYERTETPPVPYPTACRPQAWDAAALIYLAQFID